MPRHVLAGVALVALGCATTPRAATVRVDLEDATESAPEAESEERRTAVTLAPIVRAESVMPRRARGDDDEELRRRITGMLRDVARLMEPLCAPECAPVMALPDPRLGAPAALGGGTAGVGSILWYRADALERASDLELRWVVAHEYGHHLGRAMRRRERSSWHEEILADVLAGCALARGRHPVADLRKRLWSRFTPVSALDELRELACGSDAEHPAFVWHDEAIESGASLCKQRVADEDAVAATAGAISGRADARAMEARGRLVDVGEREPCRRRSLPQARRF